MTVSLHCQHLGPWAKGGKTAIARLTKERQPEAADAAGA